MTHEETLMERISELIRQDREVQSMQGVRGVFWNPDFLTEQILELVEGETGGLREALGGLVENRWDISSEPDGGWSTGKDLTAAFERAEKLLRPSA